MLLDESAEHTTPDNMEKLGESRDFGKSTDFNRDGEREVSNAETERLAALAAQTQAVAQQHLEREQPQASMPQSGDVGKQSQSSE